MATKRFAPVYWVKPWSCFVPARQAQEAASVGVLEESDLVCSKCMGRGAPRYEEWARSLQKGQG